MAIVIDQLNVGQLGADSSSDTIVLTTTATVAANGFVVLFLTWYDAADTITCSGVTGGLTWALDKASIGTPSSMGLAIASAQAPSGLASGATITAQLTGTSGGGRSAAATSFTGVATSSALDTTSGPTAPGTGTPWATPSTAIAAGSVLLGLALDFAALNTSAPVSPSLEAHDFGNGGFATTSCYRIEASAGSYTVAGNWNASVPIGSASMIGAAYKAAAGGTNITITPGAAPATGQVTSPAAMHWPFLDVQVG